MDMPSVSGESRGTGQGKAFALKRRRRQSIKNGGRKQWANSGSGSCGDLYHEGHEVTRRKTQPQESLRPTFERSARDPPVRRKRLRSARLA